MILKQDFDEKSSNLQSRSILFIWNDHIDVTNKHKNHRFKLSEFSNFKEVNYSMKKCYIFKFNLEKYIDENKIEIKKFYDILIQINEKSTRSIRFNSRWNKILIEKKLWYVNFEEIEMLFYDDFKSQVNFWSTETKFIVRHWKAKRKQLIKKLRRWQKSHNTQ